MEIKIRNYVVTRYYQKLNYSIFCNLRSKKIYTFDGVAAFVSKIVKESNQKPIELKTIVSLIEKQFNCTPNHKVENDIIGILLFLEKNDLVEFYPKIIDGYEKSATNNMNIYTINDTDDDSVERKISDMTTSALIPYHATFEITNNCSLRCIHCYCQPQFSGRWNIESFSKTLDVLKELGTMNISLTGGECLLHPNIKEFLSIIREKEFGCGLLTNGMAINQEMAQLIASCYPRYVQISLFSLDPETNDSITQVKESHKKILRGIYNLQDVGINPEIACTVMAKNYDVIEEVADWCNSNNLECKFNFKVFPSYSDARKNVDELSCIQNRSLKDTLSNSKFNPFLEKAGNNNRSQQPKGNVSTSMFCRAGFSSITFNANGDVVPCNMISLVAGNVFEDELKNIWFNSPILKKWRSIQIDDYPKCVDCEALGTCKPCLAGNFIKYGNLDNVDEYTCSLGKSYYEAEREYCGKKASKVSKIQ